MNQSNEWIFVAILFSLSVCIFWLIQRFLINTILTRLENFLVYKQKTFHAEILKQINKPVRYLLFSLSVLYIFHYLVKISWLQLEHMQNFIVSFLVFFTTQSIYRVLSYFEKHPETLKNRLHWDIENVLFPFLSKIMKLFLVVVAFSIIIFQWGYDINGVVAGLGISGVAIAMGARELLAHLFAGVSLVLDKPYNIGDWISVQDTEGIVEDINFRSTRIRTTDNQLIVVPNGVLANQPIVNWTLTPAKKVEHLLSFSLENTEKDLKQFCQEAISLITTSPLLKDKTLHVNLDAFNRGRYDILVNFELETSDIKTFYEEKERLLFLLLPLIPKHSLTLVSSTALTLASSPS